MSVSASAITASWYHCSVKLISRSSGRTAIAAAAYRAGARLHDEQLGKTYDYTRRRGIETSFIVAPENAPAWAYHLERLWNEAQAKDTRKNSCLARECELALPSVLDATDREQIARDFALHLVERYGVAVSVALHEPSHHGDERNYHAHILFSTRRMNENGFWEKTRELDDRIRTGPQEVIHLREYAATLINQYLEDAGLEERVDHRSFEDRGIDRIPSEHLGPDACAMERRGEDSRIGDQNREIKARNEHLDALVHELAVLDAEIAQAMETSFLPQEGQEPKPEPEIPITWEEEKAAAQSAFDSHIVEYYKQLIFEPDKKPEPETAMTSPLAPQESKAGLTGEEQQAAAHRLFPQPEQEQQTTEIPPVQTELSGRSWEEQKRLAQRAVEAVKQLYPLREEAEPQQQDRSLSWEERKREAQSAIREVERDYPVEAQQEAQAIATGLSWEEQKKAAQDASHDAVVKGYLRDIQETGEIREYGLGHSWYERALTRLENMYADTIRYVKDMYQKHVGRHLFPSPDRDIDLDR